MKKWASMGATGVAALVIVSCAEGPTTPTPRIGAVTVNSTVVTGAAFTTINLDADGTDHCKNGNGENNCNIYDGKEFVWMSGGPDAAAIGGAGTYFFAVLQPSGQGGNDNPNDGTDGNLSDLSPTTNTGAGDDYTKRIFSIDANGVITYPLVGAHDFDPVNNKIRLMGYDNTPNPGGVYILAICALPDPIAGGEYPPGVDPSDCKYDAFKILDPGDPCEDGCGGGGNTTLDIDKTLTTSFTRQYAWTIDKSSTTTGVTLVPGQSTVVNYDVKVTHDDGTDSDFAYSGTVVVTNTGLTPATNVNIVDPFAPSLDCGQTLPVASLEVGGVITCSYSETQGTSDNIDNTATVSWNNTEPGGNPLQAADIASGSFTTPTTVEDDCIDVSDAKATPSTFLGKVCVGDANPTTFSYSLTITAPTGTANCGSTVTFTNKAEFTTNTSSTNGDDTYDVTETIVCGCTLGYWKNNDLYDWKRVNGNYAFSALAGGANGGTGDWYWKNTNALAPSYGWANGAPSVYRSKSSKLNNAQAFGTTALSDPAYSTLASLGFYQALSLPGGTNFIGKAQNLMRQATAGLLNATWGNGTKTIGYPISAATLVADVNTALASKNATNIENLQKILAGYNQSSTQDLTNNHSCPLNAAGNWWEH